MALVSKGMAAPASNGHISVEWTMIFMSQSGLTAPERQAEWDQWYTAHLQVMLTVDGIDSAQRFKLIEGEQAPSLAMYTVASPDTFQDAHYLRIRGMGEWLPLIDRRYYRRNLFAGLEAAPDVSASDVLLIAYRDAPDPELGGMTWTWLEAVALDCAPPYRGIAVVLGTAASHACGAGVAIYRPVTARLRQ